MNSDETSHPPGADAHTRDDRLVACPVCSSLSGGRGCPDCDGTGQVTPREADVLERILSDQAPTVG